MASTSTLSTTTTTTTPLFLLLLLLLFSTAPSLAQASDRPVILVIMADDLGWADVGFNDANMATPNIDRLAAEGVKLNYAYMDSTCSPSRAAFLTGLYPFRYGMQHSVLFATANESVPLDRRFFTQDLKQLGYRTHFVGKWHLGFCREDMTPTYRGFDTFYGMYTGKGTYYTHVSKQNGYDLQDNVGHGPGKTFAFDIEGNNTYSTYLFTNRTVKIIQEHDLSQPLFVFLSYQAVHGPLEVPEKYQTQDCGHVADVTRRAHCALGAAMDEGIGQVMAALEARNLINNTITLFTTDNGGFYKLGSSNHPLRGSKITPWEGGTRAVTVLHSKKYLPNAPYTWNGLMHAVDWYPTILSMAGKKMATCHMDGLDNWERIVQNNASLRTEFVYTINEVKNNSALRWNNYKLLKLAKPSPSGWYNPPPGEAAITRQYSMNGVYTHLFDLDQDPSETNNLSDDPNYQQIKETMEGKLKAYAAELEATRPKQKVRAGLPENNNGFWTTGWC